MLQVFGLTVSGIILLVFGYSLFFGASSPFADKFHGFFSRKHKDKFVKGTPGDPQTCPVCSIKMIKGDLVKSQAFPSITGGKDRLIYIRGCYSCLENNLPRACPVCGSSLTLQDYLVARMFERSRSRNHVHVLGCNHCKRTGSMIK
jgi:RNA polymerase subunit RPABC4/transcription elongation factor Spt4